MPALAVRLPPAPPVLVAVDTAFVPPLIAPAATRTTAPPAPEPLAAVSAPFSVRVSGAESVAPFDPRRMRPAPPEVEEVVIVPNESTAVAWLALVTATVPPLPVVPVVLMAPVTPTEPLAEMLTAPPVTPVAVKAATLGAMPTPLTVTLNGA